MKNVGINAKHFFINKLATSLETTPWKVPVNYIKYNVCTSINISPDNSFHVVEISALNDLASSIEILKNELKEANLKIESTVKALSTSKNETPDLKSKEILKLREIINYHILAMGEISCLANLYTNGLKEYDGDAYGCIAKKASELNKVTDSLLKEIDDENT
jgi:hypothetical protein